MYHEEIIAVRFPGAETIEEWAERMNRAERPKCGCGCGTTLVILPRHRSMGLPRYAHGHNPSPVRCGFDNLREQGYKLVGEVATQLGVSGTTLRRMEAQGMIPKAKRIAYAHGKEARAYTDSQVRAMVRSKVRERWRREHPGRWL